MLFLAIKNLVQEKTRLLISVGGVAFSVLLILSIQGLYQGWSNKIGEYIRTVPADYWITQTGATDMFHTPSVLPLTVRDFLAGVDGVGSAKPFSGRRVAFAHNGKDINLYVIADDTENNVGAPARVVEGKSVPGKGEIIIDRVVGRSQDIRIGDTIPVAGRELKVAGYSEGGYILSFSFAFATKEDAESILQLPGATNFFLVTVKNGADPAAVVSRIEADPAVDAISKDRFVENNTNIVRDTFLPIILVLLLIGIAVGMTVIGLTIFTSTIEKAREYGVLKAIGVSNRQLYTVVIEQAVTAAVLGYVVGAALALAVSAAAGSYVPEFITEIRWLDAAWILGVTLVMAVAASLLPVRRLSRIDPAEVFRA
ncbi:ABC transporter permease [Pseudarthrobacter oxydans]|uniref:ABC transporter permease n=1 Tax=Pseudarthrobacter oxydans TaxID=1671 RepID=UPI0015741D6C|nr:ABC transporter permease [Pseudarthrobacter oxydans]NSX38521.1 ABC transporter permease [Pseudarthrobacter oxydans]